jgi:LmbE family N-acetylglucosaminyl deacetylase
MTHPDDEISICAWVRYLVASGAEVHLSWTHHTKVRKYEAGYSAEYLGVPEDRLFFHAGRDGDVCDQIEELTPSFSEMVNLVQPDRICCGAFEQGHLDHDATNLLVNKTFCGLVFEIPFYHTYLNRMPIVNRFAQPDGQEIIKLPREVQAFKVAFSKIFTSQSIYRNLQFSEVRRTFRLESPEEALRKTERMRLQSHTDFLTPNLPEPLASKVRSSPKWQRWEKAVRAIL